MSCAEGHPKVAERITTDLAACRDLQHLEIDFGYASRFLWVRAGC